MKREQRASRPDWQIRCESIGFHFHSEDGRYWDETACYAFTAEEINRLESATNDMHALCLQAVDHVVREGRLREFAIPESHFDYVTASWHARDPSLFGRFDFSWDGASDPKLLEYNADTPTSLMEAAIVQWYWLQDVQPHRDQFNSLHESLIAQWQAIRKRLPVMPTVHFACIGESIEDRDNLDYLRDTALQAGLLAPALTVNEIGWDESRRRFVDLQNQPIVTLFKLYPWEWMLSEGFGSHLPECGTRFIEPPWKMLLSNKALLVILWELFPGHPNLLPAFRTPDSLGAAYARKPLLSREGSNVTLRDGRELASTPGHYGEEGFIYQALSTLPKFDGRYAVVGSWIVGDAAHGMGIREDSSPITGNMGSFVPHYFS